MNKNNIILLNPFSIFLFIWLLMLVFFHLKVSYFFGNYDNLSSVIFFISILYFGLGFFTFFFVQKLKPKKNHCFIVYYNKNLLKFFVGFLLLLSIIIIILNYILYGPPPLIGFFTHRYIDYLHYGKLKNILFANVIFLFIISYFYRGIISFLLKIFSIIILLLYVSRGNIIFMFLFYIYFYLMNNNISNLKLFFYVVLGLIGMILLFQIVGEYRTGNNVFYNVMEIKEQYRISNAGIIWIIAYISMPLDNLLHFVSHNLNYFGNGENIISRSLPAFMQFNSESVEIYHNLLPNQYNTVSTYLSWVYFDFGILGIVLFNYLIGLMAGYIWFFIRYKGLFVALYLTCLSLIFFNDYFFYFMTIILLFYSYFMEKFIIKRFKYGFHHYSNI